jgi:hypothetical protein
VAGSAAAARHAARNGTAGRRAPRRAGRRPAVGAQGAPGRGHGRQRHGRHAHARADEHQAPQRERVEQRARDAGGGDDAHDHHDPEPRGHAAELGRRRPLRRRGEQGGAGRAQAEADRRVRHHAHQEAGRAVRGRERGPGGREHGAQSEAHGATHHPRRAARARRVAPAVRREAEPRPRELHGEVQRHERARHRRRERELDHHDSVERAEHERRHRTDRHLREPEADHVAGAEPDGVRRGRDGRGGEHRGGAHGRTPAAAAIMPST